MGVSGSGKTTIGGLLAQSLGYNFHDADGFHPPENVKKMASGTPLTDEDRKPWLASLKKLLSDSEAEQQSIVLACSSLREAFRHELRSVTSVLHFVFLKGDFALISERMQKRTNHYMKAGMLQSQFSTLEEPHDAACVVDINDTPQVIVSKIVASLPSD